MEVQGTCCWLRNESNPPTRARTGVIGNSWLQAELKPSYEYTGPEEYEYGGVRDGMRKEVLRDCGEISALYGFKGAFQYCSFYAFLCVRGGGGGGRVLGLGSASWLEELQEGIIASQNSCVLCGGCWHAVESFW